MDDNAVLTVGAEQGAVDLADLSRDLRASLEAAGIRTAAVEDPAAAGARGDAVTFTQIVLGFVSGGALVSLIGCLKAYIERERSLGFTIKRPDGTAVEVNAKNIDSRATQEALEAALSCTKG